MGNNEEKVITIGDKVKTLVSVENGQSISLFTEEEKLKSISKSDIFNTAYNEVDENIGYDNSEEAIQEVLDSFKKASEEQGSDPIKQNGFVERFNIDGEMLDVALIKGTNAVCNNATQGSYQAVKLSIKLDQTSLDNVDTVEGEWDLDLSGKKIDLNRPGKTALEDGKVTSYLNKGNLSLSAVFPITGNDQAEFDKHFQDNMSKTVSYGLSDTLTKLLGSGVDKEELAKAEVKLTARSSIEDMIGIEVRARHDKLSDEEVAETVSAVYPAVASDLDIKPLTSKNITISLQSSLVEKELKCNCEWSSTSSKWKVISTSNHIMRYRPIASANHTFPIVDASYDELCKMTTSIFKSYINICNKILCEKLGLESIAKIKTDIVIPQHATKLSEVIGVEKKDLFKIKKNFKEEVSKVINQKLDQRDANTKTETLKNLNDSMNG